MRSSHALRESVLFMNRSFQLWYEIMSEQVNMLTDSVLLFFVELDQRILGLNRSVMRFCPHCSP